MRTMTHKEKIKYKKLVSEAKQLCFDIKHFEDNSLEDGLPLYICKDGYKQYFFSRYPADDHLPGETPTERSNEENI